MIKNNFLIPEYFIQKVPICDECGTVLQYTGIELLSNPPLLQHRCPKCSKIYNISSNDLQGEWKWRTI